MWDEVLAKAERSRRHVQTYNALCLDYVAMTRAKLALTLILNPPNAKTPPEPEKFSDLVRLVGLKTCGDGAWYMNVKRPAAAPAAKRRQIPARGPRLCVRKSRPGESFYSGLAGVLLCLLFLQLC